MTFALIDRCDVCDMCFVGVGGYCICDVGCRLA